MPRRAIAAGVVCLLVMSYLVFVCLRQADYLLALFFSISGLLVTAKWFADPFRFFIEVRKAGVRLAVPSRHLLRFRDLVYIRRCDIEQITLLKSTFGLTMSIYGNIDVMRFTSRREEIIIPMIVFPAHTDAVVTDALIRELSIFVSDER